MTRRGRWKPGLLFVTAALAFGWTASAPRHIAAPQGRVLSDVELEAVVGGGGGPAAITFEQSVSGSYGSAGQTATWRFTRPTTGPDVVASFRVADATIYGSPGTYLIEVRKTSDNSLVASAQSAQPTLLQDVVIPTSGTETAYNVNVKDISGTIPRSFTLTMSPRYSAPQTTLAFPDFKAAQLPQGGVQTYKITVDSSSLGATDLYFRDNGISGGDNIVTVLQTDRVGIKARDIQSGDVSLDNTPFPEMAFTQTGDYLVIVSNQSTSGTGFYDIQLGPYPGEPPPNDDTAAPCEVIGNPTFTTPVTSPTRAINEVGDRDCFQTTLPTGATEVTITFHEVAPGGSGSNEVRLLQGANVIKGKTGGNTFALVANVDVSGATYQIEINNRKDGTPTYYFTVALTGACSGTSCILSPENDVLIQEPANTWTTRPVRADQAGDPLPMLPTPANASFQLDNGGTGTFDLQVWGDKGSGAQLLCAVSGTGNSYLENCDISTVDGLPYIQVRSSTGANSTIRMGPELANKPSDGPIYPSGTPTDGELVGFGDEDFRIFTLATAGQIGIGFNDRGLGPNDGNVHVCHIEDFLACLKHDASKIIVQYTGPGDGGAPAKAVPAGTYVAIIDNMGLGDGDYSVCLGSLDSPADEEITGTPFTVTGDQQPSTPVMTRTGFLYCGDSDMWNLTNDTEQLLTIKAQEAAGTSGQIQLDVLRNVPGWENAGHCDTGNPAFVACAGGSSTATITAVNLGSTTPYIIRVDNDKYGGGTSTTGAGGYTLKVGDPNATF